MSGIFYHLISPVISLKCLCWLHLFLLASEVGNSLQIYGLSGTIGTNPLPVGHMSPQPGSPGYTMVRGYLMPGPHMVQYHRPNASGAITDGTTTMQIPYHSGSIASVVHFSFHLNLHLNGFEHWNNDWLLRYCHAISRSTTDCSPLTFTPVPSG